MRNPVMLRDTAGEEDKHEQSLLIIDRTVLAGWTFLVLKKRLLIVRLTALCSTRRGT